MVESKVRDHHKLCFNTNQITYRSLAICARSPITINNGKKYDGLSVITFKKISLIDGL